MARVTGCMETSVLARDGRPVPAISIVGLREISVGKAKQAS